jgi:hypothetical protein
MSLIETVAIAMYNEHCAYERRQRRADSAARSRVKWRDAGRNTQRVFRCMARWHLLTIGRIRDNWQRTLASCILFAQYKITKDDYTHGPR